MKLGHAIANFFSGFWDEDLKPWLKTLFDEIRHDIVNDILPILADAADEAGHDLTAPGSLADKAEKIAQIIVASAKKIEQSGVDIAIHDVVQAGAALLAQASAKAKASAT